jgi:hypothetical protein
MPASLKSFRNSLKEKLSLKEDKNNKEKSSSGNVFLAEYNKTSSEDALESKTMINKPESFTNLLDEVKSSSKIQNSEENSTQTKDLKKDDDTKSVKSRTSSIISRFSFRKKSKKDEKESKARLKSDNTLDKILKKRSDETKSVSSFREKIKSNTSKNSELKKSDDSNIWTTKGSNELKLVKDEDKSIKSSRNSILSKKNIHKEELQLETPNKISDFSFEKIKFENGISSRVFEGVANGKQIIMIVKDDTQESFPYSMKSGSYQYSQVNTPSLSSEKAVLIKNIEPAKSQSLTEIVKEPTKEPMVLIQYQAETSRDILKNKETYFKGLIETRDKHGRLQGTREMSAEELESYNRTVFLANGVTYY